MTTVHRALLMRAALPSLLVAVASTSVATVLVRGTGGPAAPRGSGTGTVTVPAGPRPSGPPGAPEPPVAVKGAKAHAFGIAGTVGGLVPGAATPLTVRITNPNPWPIQVVSIDTTVVPQGGTAGCGAGALRVGRYAYAAGDAVVTAPARGGTTLTVPAELVDSVASSGCAGASFGLRFTGNAVQVRP